MVSGAMLTVAIVTLLPLMVPLAGIDCHAMLPPPLGVEYTSSSQVVALPKPLLSVTEICGVLDPNEIVAVPAL